VVKYFTDAVPVQTRPHSVWEVRIEGEPPQIHIWHERATLPEVWRSVKARHPEWRFRVGQLGVGAYQLGPVVDQAYREDARYVNQDGEVVLDGD
jgi:hypothetical protein